MTRRLLTALALALFTLAACGRATQTTGVTVSQVYAAGVRVSDIASSLPDSSNWWPGPPQFGTRPLDSSTRPEEERFDVTFRFSHVGTAESMVIVYRVWYSSQLADAIMTTTQQAVGSSMKGPSAGDAVLYFQQKLSFGAAPYVSEALVRVGQTVVAITESRSLGFASTNEQGGIAKKVASRLKDSLAGKLRATRTSPEASALPPPGPELTLLGTDRLPVEVVAQMVGAAAPTDVAAVFHHLGATDFVYADFALNADTHMEVQTSAFTFSSSTGGTDFMNQFVGKAALDQNGDYFDFDQSTGQYIAAFGIGSHGVLMICRSSAELEAASRACESPMSRVANAWKTGLSG